MLCAPVALAIASLPAISLWAGLRVAQPLHVALAGDPELARPLALAAGVSGALCGALVTTTAPMRRSLGAQLEPAPLSRLTLFAGLAALPVALLLSLAVPAALFLVPVVGRATPVALAALGCALALGGAATEALIALSRGGLRGTLTVGGIATIGVLDPLEPAADALRGGRAPTAFAFALAAVVLWAVAAAARPDERRARGTVRISTRGTFATAAARYARRPELLRHAAVAVGFAAAGGALLRGSGTPPHATVLLAGTTAVVGAALVPLAAPGLDARAEWLWRAAPVRRSRLSLAFALAAVVTGGALAAVGVAAAWAVSPAAPADLAPLAAAGAVTIGAGLVAGALVGWRADRPGEQLASFAVLAAVLAVWSFALAQAASLVGAEEGFAAAALAAGSLGTSVGLAVALSTRWA